MADAVRVFSLATVASCGEEEKNWIQDWREIAEKS